MKEAGKFLLNAVTVRFRFRLLRLNLRAAGKEAKRFISIEGKASDIYGLSQKNAGSRDDDFRAAVRIEKNEN